MSNDVERTITKERKTAETLINLTLWLDGSGQIRIDTGIGFFNHLLTTLAFYAGWDIDLVATGDLHVDDHHTVEDCALIIGMVINDALGDRAHIARFGSAYAPHDESLARAVVDLSNRPYAVINLGLTRDSISELACENIPHFLESLARSAGMTLHMEVLYGNNDHHRAEAAFKALGQALARAIYRDENNRIKSIKGVI